MTTIGTNSTAAQLYGGVQRTNNSPVNGVKAPSNRADKTEDEVSVPRNATPRGDWVLSENANPQSFDANAPRGSYLNLVV